MKNRHKKRILYRLTRPQHLSAQALKGLIRKPAKPVSVEEMNEAWPSAILEDWAAQELARKASTQRYLQAAAETKK